MNETCLICGKPASIIGIVKYTIEDDDEIHHTELPYCQLHYEEWRNNEIEIPAERLEALDA